MLVFVINTRKLIGSLEIFLFVFSNFLNINELLTFNSRSSLIITITVISDCNDLIYREKNLVETF